MSAVFPQPPVEPRDAEPFVEEAPREIHLAEYWAILVKRRRLVVLSIGAVTAVALVLSFLSTPIYRATVVLDVEKDRESPLDIGSGQVVYWDYAPEFVPTQMRLMRSIGVAERVVRRLNLAENPEFNPPVRGGAPASGADVTERLAARLIGGLEVVAIRGTNLVELSYSSSSQKLAGDLAMAQANAYVEWIAEAKYRVVGQASQFLGAQIEQLKAEVEDRERKLQAYSRSKDIVSMDPKANITLQKLESLNRDYAAAVGERVSKEARWYEVQTGSPLAIAETSSGGLVTQLRNDQLKLEREYAEKLNLFKPEWPAMQQLRAQIAKGKQNLDAAIEETVNKAREAARSDYQTALRREESLKEVLRSQKAEAMTLNTNAIEYNNLRVEVSTKRTLLDTLLKRQSETEVASRLSGARQSSVRVVDRAFPYAAKFRPSHRRNGMLGLFLGTALGVGLAFFLEYMDRSLRRPEQVEQFLKLPPLGLIPAVGPESVKKGYGYGFYPYGKRRREEQKPVPAPPAIELLPHLHPRSTPAEAYRAFRAALLLSRAGGVKSIVITSGFPHEGKTSTAVNLAIVLGQLGGTRVLLVDADLHKPRLHEILKVSNRVGLVSILAENADLSIAVQATSLPGISFLAAGPTSPNPSGLLASEAMAALIKRAEAEYDFVVLDSPPVQAVADAILLGHQADGVVLCVKGGHTPREHVARVRDRLYQSRVSILGVLINNLAEAGTGYGARYHGYDSYRGVYGEESAAAAAPISQTGS